MGRNDATRTSADAATITISRVVRLCLRVVATESPPRGCTGGMIVPPPGGVVNELGAGPPRWAARRSADVPRAHAQAYPAGPDDGLGAVGDLQLGEDVRDVVAHRLVAEEQPLGDRRVAQPL